jgi:Uncharacterized protein conserved in bacteria
MEQKKILWIVVAVCVFVLIVFGAALVLYSPSRSTGQNLKQATAVAVTPATKNDISKDAVQAQSQIDPDSWVRQPGNTPGIDPHAKPNANGINLTIVNGDNTGANYGTLDVSGLTNPQQPAATGDQQTLPLSSIPGQDTKVINQTSQTDGTAATGTSDPAAKGASTTVITNTIVKSSGKANTTVHANATPAKPTKAPADQKSATKEVAKKPVSDTGFWIQTGSFSNKTNAEKARETLGARYLTAEIFTKDSAGKTAYRVRVGPYKTRAEADYWLGTVKEIPGFSNSFVSEVKAKN